MIYAVLLFLFLQRKLKQLIGNYTFLEAYERTGRILNVSVCPADTNEPARLLNYLTAPQVRVLLLCYSVPGQSCRFIDSCFAGGALRLPSAEYTG